MRKENSGFIDQFREEVPFVQDSTEDGSETFVGELDKWVFKADIMSEADRVGAI